MELHKKQDQQMVERLVVTGSVAFDGPTPSGSEVSKEIARVLQKNPSLVVVKKISTSFGKREAVVSAVVYNDQTAKQRYEVMTRKMREDQAKAEKEKASQSSRDVPAASAESSSTSSGAQSAPTGG